MRIVLDTNTLIRAHGEADSLARRLLMMILVNDHRLVLSNAILAEVTRVLRYARFQTLYRLTDEALLRYVQFLQSSSDMVSLPPFYLAPLRDPSDWMVLQTAEVGNADFLCTSDRDFFAESVLTYAVARGIDIGEEPALLDRLMARSTPPAP